MYNFKENKIKELRQASGIIKSEDPIVEFLYELMRDHLPVGVVESLVQATEEHRERGDMECIFTNGWLASYAVNLSERLKVK